MAARILRSCCQCHGTTSDVHNLLLVCSECRRDWHHRCNDPPLSDAHLLSLMRATARHELEGSLHDWECGVCSARKKPIVTRSKAPPVAEIVDLTLSDDDQPQRVPPSRTAVQKRPLPDPASLPPSKRPRQPQETAKPSNALPLPITRREPSISSEPPFIDLTAVPKRGRPISRTRSAASVSTISSRNSDRPSVEIIDALHSGQAPQLVNAGRNARSSSVQVPNLVPHNAPPQQVPEEDDFDSMYVSLPPPEIPPAASTGPNQGTQPDPKPPTAGSQRSIPLGLQPVNDVNPVELVEDDDNIDLTYARPRPHEALPRSANQVVDLTLDSQSSLPTPPRTSTPHSPSGAGFENPLEQLIKPRKPSALKYLAPCREVIPSWVTAGLAQLALSEAPLGPSSTRKGRKSRAVKLDNPGLREPAVTPLLLRERLDL